MHGIYLNWSDLFQTEPLPRDSKMPALRFRSVDVDAHSRGSNAVGDYL